MPQQLSKQQHWSAILKEYHTRECTQKEFCVQRGINAATLQYHLSKERERGAFHPAVVSESEPQPSVELSFPGGIRLTIRR